VTVHLGRAALTEGGKPAGIAAVVLPIGAHQEEEGEQGTQAPGRSAGRPPERLGRASQCAAERRAMWAQAQAFFSALPIRAR
jgi:hypothetical protein